MDKITAVGLDLAKQIIQVHTIDTTGRVVLRKVVQRERLLALLAQFPKDCEHAGFAQKTAPGVLQTEDPYRRVGGTRG